VSFYKGFSYAEKEYKEALLIQQASNSKKLVEAVKESEIKIRGQYERYIKTIKKVDNLPDTCILSSEFRIMHDSAAGLPEVTTASTVTVKEVATTINDNYLACQQNAVWLEECNRICN
jgi:hypothetical protein